MDLSGIRIGAVWRLNTANFRPLFLSPFKPLGSDVRLSEEPPGVKYNTERESSDSPKGFLFLSLSYFYKWSREEK